MNPIISVCKPPPLRFTTIASFDSAQDGDVIDIAVRNEQRARKRTPLPTESERCTRFGSSPAAAHPIPSHPTLPSSFLPGSCLSKIAAAAVARIRGTATATLLTLLYPLAKVSRCSFRFRERFCELKFAFPVKRSLTSLF